MGRALHSCPTAAAISLKSMPVQCAANNVEWGTVWGLPLTHAHAVGHMTACMPVSYIDWQRQPVTADIPHYVHADWCWLNFHFHLHLKTATASSSHSRNTVMPIRLISLSYTTTFTMHQSIFPQILPTIVSLSHIFRLISRFLGPFPDLISSLLFLFCFSLLAFLPVPNDQ